MFRVAREQRNRMGNQMQNSFERLDGPARISRNVEDQTSAKGSAHSAAQRGQRRVFQPLAPHLLSKSFKNAVAYGARGLRRDIAGSNPRAARSDDQLRSRCLLAKSKGNLFLLIRNNQRSIDDKARYLETRNDVRPRTVLPVAFKTGIADGNDSGLHIRDSTF